MTNSVLQNYLRGGGRVIIPLILLLALPWVLYPPLALDIVAWALFAIALDLCFGVTGLISFGHALFWGTAAYATGNIAIAFGWPFPIAVLVAAVVVAILAIPVGWLSIRRVGFYLAMVTLALAQVGYFVATQWTSFTGGENGLQGIPRDFFGFNLSDGFTFYYLALPMLACGFWLTSRVRRSPFGRVLEAVRDDPVRTQALGYSVNRYRMSVFVISAFFSGIAGGIYAISHTFVSLGSLTTLTSGLVLVMVVLGGMRSQWGPAIGAAIIIWLQDFFATAGFELGGAVTGLLFAIAVVALRKGIWGTLVDGIDRLKNGSKRRSAPPEPSDHENELQLKGEK